MGPTDYPTTVVNSPLGYSCSVCGQWVFWNVAHWHSVASGGYVPTESDTLKGEIARLTRKVAALEAVVEAARRLTESTAAGLYVNAFEDVKAALQHLQEGQG